jgi:WD40 repeat protein
LPEGALARLGTVRLRAAGALVALSPDGKTIVTVARGRVVKWYDAGSGKLVRQRELPTDISGAAFLSPDGRILAARAPDLDSPLDVWDVASAKRLHRLPVPPGTGVYRAAFSPDGKLLAVAQSGAAPDNLRLWDVAAETPRALKGHAAYVETLVFSPDGKSLATLDGQRLICWDTAGGAQLWQARVAHNSSLAFTPDGRTLIASPGSRERSWHAWEAATGRPADGLKLPEGYHYAQPAVAPDGRNLVFAQSLSVVGADGRVRVWDLRAGKLLHTLPVAGAVGPFAPDGRSFLTNNGTLQRWDLATGRRLLPDTAARGHRLEVARVAYSPDGRLLGSASHDGSVRLWEVATARPLHVLSGYGWGASDLQFTADGQYLVSADSGGNLRVWDVGAGREARTIPLSDAKSGEKKPHVSRLAVTPDGRTAFVLGYDPNGGGLGLEGTLTGWDLASGRRTTRAAAGPTDGLYSAFAPDGRSLASRGLLIDTATGKERVRLEGAGHFAHYAFSPDGRLLAGLVTRTESDGTRFSTKAEGTQVWEVATGRAGRRLRTDWVGQLAFTPDGRYLATADLDGLRLWELATGEVVLQHKAHERTRGSYGHSFASCLAFAPDGRTLTTGHLDSTILVWNAVPTGRPPAAADLPRLWDELAGPDAARAYAASWRLTDAPAPALPLLRKHLRPVTPAPAETVRPLLADLDSNDFRQREAAAARLRELGDRAGAALREAAKASPPPEKRRRLEALLKALERTPSGAALREVRAATVLERVGTAEARALLKELAGGVADARLTREAKASLERLARRRAAAP